MTQEKTGAARYEELESAGGAVLHIRYEGTSRDIPLDLLRLSAGASDEELRAAVALYLDIRESNLARYVVERHPNGNFTLRPEALFG